MAAKYLSAAIACKRINAEQAVLLLKAKQLTEVKKLGVIARDLGFMDDSDLEHVEMFLKFLKDHDVDLPDLVAEKGRDLFESQLPDFVLQEYWQLRQEIRDRLNSIRTVVGVTVAAFTATIAGTATLLSNSGKIPSFFALSLLWLAPQAILLPAMRIILAERLSILRMASYLRLHAELPFFEAGVRLWPYPKENGTFLRMPVGWESHLLQCRWAADDINEVQSSVYRGRRKHKRRNITNPFGGYVQPPPSEETLAFDRSVYDNEMHRGAIEAHHYADRMESTSITWLMRTLSSASTLFSAAFILLVYSSPDEITKIVDAVGYRWVAHTACAVILALAIALLVVLWFLTKRFSAAYKVRNFWGMPSLDDKYAHRLIKRFRDYK